MNENDIREGPTSLTNPAPDTGTSEANQAHLGPSLLSSAHGETAQPQPPAPSEEDVLRRFLAIENTATDRPAELRWHGDSELQETEAHTFCDRPSEQVLREAHRILRRMVALNADRVRTGRNPIPNN